MIVQNNISALSANRQLGANLIKLQSNLEKLSSGYRINRAADDAAGLSISERMRAQMTALERAMLNAQDGASMVQTAEGGLTEVHSMLNRLTELATYASNGTLQASDRQRIDAESQSLLQEIDRISQATNFNGISLLDGSLSDSSAKSVGIQGVQVDTAAAQAGEYAFAALTDQTGLQAGDSLEYTIATNQGDSYTVRFEVGDSLDSIRAFVNGEHTADIALESPAAAGATTVDIAGTELASALAGQLNGTTLANNFVVQENAGALSFESRTAGTEAPQVASFDVQATTGGVVGGYSPVARDAAASTAAADAQSTISADAFTTFNGSNAGSAVFQVNGQKFALVASGAGFADNVAKLGADVSVIRVSGDNLSAGDMKEISAQINQKTGMAFEAAADGSAISVKAPGGNGLVMQVGDTADSFNQMMVSVGNMSSRGLGLSGISMLSQESAARALDRISAAIDRVSSTRGDLGALQNRLDHTLSNLGVTNENLTAAESRIRDTDMAKMIIEFTKNSMLAQSAQAMQAQANMNNQQVLQLLR